MSWLICAWLVLQAAPAPVPVPGPERPHDPWVFRSVLDGRARMLTIALDEDMWIAYDATTCGLYKAWKGGVEFDGAVYTTVHGPQPTSRGATYTVGYDRPVWTAETKTGPIGVEARWRGYRLQNNRVVLLYDLVLDDGRVLRIEEEPQFARPEDRFDEAQREEATLFVGDAGLLRFFYLVDAPEDVRVKLDMRTDGGRAKHSRMLVRERFVDIEREDGSVYTEVHSQLVLGKPLPRNHLLLFFEPLADFEPAHGAAEEQRR